MFFVECQSRLKLFSSNQSFITYPFDSDTAPHALLHSFYLSQSEFPVERGTAAAFFWKKKSFFFSNVKKNIFESKRKLIFPFLLKMNLDYQKNQMIAKQSHILFYKLSKCYKVYKQYIQTSCCGSIKKATGGIYKYNISIILLYGYLYKSTCRLLLSRYWYDYYYCWFYHWMFRSLNNGSH